MREAIKQYHYAQEHQHEDGATMPHWWSRKKEVGNNAESERRESNEPGLDHVVRFS